MSAVQQETRFEGYFALDMFYGFIRWLEGFISIVEELISVLSGPLLAIGLSFSLVDFLMQGSLLRDGHIALAWSIVQAAAVDAQLVLMWHKSKMAVRAKNGWAFLGFVMLGLALAFVAFGAVALQSLQQSAGMDSAKALSSLGLTAEELVYARSAVAIILACVAGWTRSPIGQAQTVRVAPTEPTKKNRTKEDKQPGFFARQWALFIYWFQLRKAVRIARKQAKKGMKGEQSEIAIDEPVEVLETVQGEPLDEHDTEPPSVSVEALIDEESEPLEECVEQEQDTDKIVSPPVRITQPLATIEPPQKVRQHNPSKRTSRSKKEVVYRYLKANPSASISDIMKHTSVTKSYASTTRSQFLNQQQTA